MPFTAGGGHRNRQGHDCQILGGAEGEARSQCALAACCEHQSTCLLCASHMLLCCAVHVVFYVASRILFCICAALKMAAHGGQPGSYAGYVITKLIERLHGAKHWLVRHLQKPDFVGLHQLAAHVWRLSLAVKPRARTCTSALPEVCSPSTPAPAPRCDVCLQHPHGRPLLLCPAAVRAEDADGVPPADAGMRGRLLRGGAAALQRPHARSSRPRAQHGQLRRRRLRRGPVRASLSAAELQHLGLARQQDVQWGCRAWLWAAAASEA